MSLIADELVAEKPEQKSSLSPLYQLPLSGNWITLLSVSGVIVNLKTKSRVGLEDYPPKVVVLLTDKNVSEIVCETDEQACEIRDKIAADRNALARHNQSW